jgi:uncharacterized iron-regulated protein
MKTFRRLFLRRLLLCAALPLLAACASVQAPPEHPLNGKLWDVGARRFIEPEQLMERAAAAHFVLLGEIHDNAEHHRIQLRVLQDLLRRGKRPALAMEQYDLDQQDSLDAARQDRRELADLMRKSWDEPLYRPLVELAVRENLPVIAANASRELLRTISRNGFAALGDNAAARYALDDTWTPARQEQLVEDVKEGHCGKVPDHVVEVIAKAQRARDALMADAILRAGPAGAVAILGNGHARTDLGVPLYLRARAPADKVLSLGIVQVDAPVDPAAYGTGPLGQRFDYVWFTARTERAADPCDSIPAMKPQKS